VVGFVDRIVAAQIASRPVKALATRGLKHEGLYLAANAWFDGWKEHATRVLGSSYFDALSRVLSPDELDTWQKLRELSEQSGVDTAILRVVALSPDAAELLEQGPADASFRRLGEELVWLGRRLIGREKYDAGLSVLACSAHSNFAGEQAIVPIEAAIARIPTRDRWDIGITKPIVTELGNSAMRLADTGHYGAAVHTRLMMPLLAGDQDDFEHLARCAIEVGYPNSAPDSNARMRLSKQLSGKGYCTQAVEMVAAGTGIAQGDQARWQQVYHAIKGPDQTTRTSRILTNLAKPAVVFAGMDLTPVSPVDSTPSTGTGETAAEGSIAPQGPPRRVNAWLSDAAEYPPNEFDVWVNIGPPREGAMGGDFRGEPDWNGREFIDLRLVISGLNADVRPGWREVRLPRVGKTDDVSFRVKTEFVGKLRLWLRVYSARESLLLDEYELVIEVERQHVQAEAP
jgi:hypothetical protein